MVLLPIPEHHCRGRCTAFLVCVLRWCLSGVLQVPPFFLSSGHFNLQPGYALLLSTIAEVKRKGIGVGKDCSVRELRMKWCRDWDGQWNSGENVLFLNSEVQIRCKPACEQLVQCKKTLRIRCLGDGKKDGKKTNISLHINLLFQCNNCRW